MARPRRLDYSEFMERFGWKVYEPTDAKVMEPPFAPSMVRELRVLAEAARHNCPSAFSIFLQQWLQRHGIHAPDGVFRAVRLGKPGRREEETVLGIYTLWLCLGRPSLSSNQLAKAYCGQAYASGNGAARKQMVDRLRRTVERYEQRNPPQAR
jgi:hypothetical protein